MKTKMKLWYLVLFSVLYLFSILHTDVNAQEKKYIQMLDENCIPIQQTVGDKFVPNEIIVHFLPGSITLPEGIDSIDVVAVKGNTEVVQLLRSVPSKKLRKVFKFFTERDTIRTLENGSKVRVQDLSQVFVITFQEKIDVPAMAKNFKAFPYVIHAQPNYIYKAEINPTDPLFSKQWGLKQSTNEDIDAPTAWEIQTGNSGIKLGIFDSGIDYVHDDLGNGFGAYLKVRGGWDWVNNDSDPLDDFFHGSHVAGIAGALTNNTNNGQNVGIAGVAGGWGYERSTGAGNKGVQLFAMKVLGSDGGGNTANIANAVVEGADPDGDGWGYGIHVLNLSLGGYIYDETFRSAVNYVARMGRVFVAAKGNDNTTYLHYPSDYDGSWVISVGATNKNGSRAQYPDYRWHYGAGSNYGNGIDVVAPGTGTLSTTPRFVTSGMEDYDVTPNYDSLSGTSMATPHVSGLAALLLTQNSSLHPEEVQGLVRASADDKGDPGYDDQYGAGRINAGRALHYLLNPWTLNQYTATGGASVGNTGPYTMEFYNTGTLPTNIYVVKRYDVRKTVNFPIAYAEPPHVWGRGPNASTGWSGANPNYETGYCKVVSSSATSAELQTYVYEVWDESGQTYYGWYPTTPGNVVFAYTVHGMPVFHYSGNIPSSTWYGYCIVDGSVTVNSGATLTINSGTIVSFTNGTSLTVNGVLNAQGTESQRITFDRSGTSGTWDRIKLNASGNSTIAYCNIYHASTGIYLYNSSYPKIHHNIISGNTSYGIDCNSSSPVLYYNTITGSTWGLNCYSYSSPYVVYIQNPPNCCPGPGHNIIKQNGTGISASYTSQPYLGQYSPDYGGYNCVHDNTGYEISAGYTLTIMAERTWWNRVPPTYPNYYWSGDFHTYQSSIDYDPVGMTNDPNNCQYQGSIHENPPIAPASVVGSPLLKVTSNENNTPSNQAFSSDDELKELLTLEMEGKLEEAIYLYIQRFNQETNSEIKKYVLARLAECYLKAGMLEGSRNLTGKDFIDFLNNDVRQKLSKTDEIYATTLEVENLFLIRNGNYDKAIANFSTIRSDFSNNKETHKNALFNLGYLYYSLLNNPVKAKEYFDELRAKYPDDEVTLNATLLTEETPDSTREKEALASSEVPNNDALLGNYPNPFNPTTAISYQLSAVSNVSLKVYDILGREVATLVDEMKEAGDYTASFDGSKLSSGIYFTRFVVKPQDGNKPFVQVKKMLLMK
jgi:parallel beta-helix repeat protein